MWLESCLLHLCTSASLLPDQTQFSPETAPLKTQLSRLGTIFNFFKDGEVWVCQTIKVAQGAGIGKFPHLNIIQTPPKYFHCL